MKHNSIGVVLDRFPFIRCTSKQQREWAVLTKQLFCLISRVFSTHKSYEDNTTDILMKSAHHFFWRWKKKTECERKHWKLRISISVRCECYMWEGISYQNIILIIVDLHENEHSSTACRNYTHKIQNIFNVFLASPKYVSPKININMKIKIVYTIYISQWNCKTFAVPDRDSGNGILFFPVYITIIHDEMVQHILVFFANA